MALPPEVIESFPEEIRSDPSWEKFNDMGSVAKSYLEVQRKKDSGLSLPDEKATPEDIEKWRGEHLPKLHARGIIELPPSKVEDYKLPEIEGYTPDKTVVDSFLKDVAFQHKLTPKQVEAVLKFEAARTAQLKSLFVDRDAAESQFKEMMGADYEATNGRITAAQKALAEDYPAVGQFAERLRVFEVDEHGKPTGKIYPFNSHPLAKSIYEIFANMTQEDNSGGSHFMGGDSVETIRGKIDEIRANDKMSGARKAEALEPLYKALMEAENREKQGRAA